MKQNTFRISAPQLEFLNRHLFPGDSDEHGAVITAGISETANGRRFLAKEVFLAKDGIDYVPGRHGYRALTSDFVARVSNHCAREGLCYFAVHCHGGQDSVSFSETDLQSHRRGYPALRDITGGPVGALVFAENAVAGEIWSASGVTELQGLTSVGLNTRRLYPRLPRIQGLKDETYHKQSLMFGDKGQHYLKDAKIGIIGLGGVGSLVNEYVARLGVGTIVGIDYDRMEHSNRSRVVGARFSDCEPERQGFLSRLFRKGPIPRSKLKVDVAKRVAVEANPEVRFTALGGDVTTEAVAFELRDADFIFLCADSMQSRLVFNALVHQYLIPGVQIGSKVPADKKSGALGNVFSTARLVLPHHGGGCLWCNGLIPASKLQEEAMSAEERRRQQYVDDVAVTAPSVITLNALGAAQSVNDFLFHYLGLFDADQAKPGYLMHYSRERVWRAAECRADKTCLHCGTSPRASYARGDRASLPCKASGN